MEVIMNKNIVFKAIMLFITLQAGFIGLTYGMKKTGTGIKRSQVAPLPTAGSGADEQSKSKSGSSSNSDSGDKKKAGQANAGKAKLVVVAAVPATGNAPAKVVLAALVSPRAGSSSEADAPGKPQLLAPVAPKAPARSPRGGRNSVPVNPRDLPAEQQLEIYCNQVLPTSLQNLFVSHPAHKMGTSLKDGGPFDKILIKRYIENYSDEAKIFTILQTYYIHLLEHEIAVVKQSIPADSKAAGAHNGVNAAQEQRIQALESANKELEERLRAKDQGQVDAKEVERVRQENAQLQQENAQLRRDLAALQQAPQQTQQRQQGQNGQNGRCVIL